MEIYQPCYLYLKLVIDALKTVGRGSTIIEGYLFFINSRAMSFFINKKELKFNNAPIFDFIIVKTR